jgi:hypothetical protein
MFPKNLLPSSPVLKMKEENFCERLLIMLPDYTASHNRNIHINCSEKIYTLNYLRYISLSFKQCILKYDITTHKQCTISSLYWTRTKHQEYHGRIIHGTEIIQLTMLISN